MNARSRAIHKAAGVLDAAYFVHARADSLREQLGARKIRWSNIHVANLLDDLADSLKGLAIIKCDEE